MLDKCHFQSLISKYIIIDDCILNKINIFQDFYIIIVMFLNIMCLTLFFSHKIYEKWMDFALRNLQSIRIYYLYQSAHII
jgi:hypothetical protein